MLAISLFHRPGKPAGVARPEDPCGLAPQVNQTDRHAKSPAGSLTGRGFGVLRNKLLAATYS
ncbi:hypothetical protein, partial [Bradymonas sediminis]|uniref:hypothetical protein n=1 Tax=Bradymonas sediminis TaxID=1548548 RepID=UPI001AACCAA1